MNASTQTYITRDRAVQVPYQSSENNINLVISENNIINNPPQVNNVNPNTHAFKTNSILCRYHKDFNERGHSIFKWRDEKDLHSGFAEKAVNSFINIGVSPPYWLNRRACFKKV
jgi:hypothetical protein